jgi:hypothetical protein
LLRHLLTSGIAKKAERAVPAPGALILADRRGMPLPKTLAERKRLRRLKGKN